MNERRTADYLLSLEPEQEPLLAALRRYAKEKGVPIVRPETERFLHTMTVLKRPKRILEIGTAIGYSAIVLARAQRLSGAEARSPRLVTIESWERRVPVARDNLERAGLSGEVRLLHRDAGEVLRELSGDAPPARTEAGDSAERQEYEALCREKAQFDLVFLDAAKGQYLNWLPYILRLMPEGGVLIADNVLQDSTVMESRFTVERRERTTHARMREFLYQLKHLPALSSSVLPLGDGVSVSVKNAGKDGRDARAAEKQTDAEE